MKSFLRAITAATVLVSATAALGGPCTYPTDTASDGSKCGGRASTVRPGGK